QQFRELDAGQLGVDRLEDALDLVRHVVLGVPQVEVAGAALEVDDDDALGLAEAGTAVAALLLGVRLQAEQVAERDAQHGRAADAQEITARDTVAGVFTGTSGDDQHGASPRSRWDSTRRVIKDYDTFSQAHRQSGSRADAKKPLPTGLAFPGPPRYPSAVLLPASEATMRIEQTMVVHCPADRLWAWIEEPDKQKQWMKGVIDNTLTSGEHG